MLALYFYWEVLRFLVLEVHVRSWISARKKVSCGAEKAVLLYKHGLGSRSLFSHVQQCPSDILWLVNFFHSVCFSASHVCGGMTPKY